MAHPSPLRRALRGITLVEVMVTIAIITLLLAMALPSVGSAVGTSRQRQVARQFSRDFQWARGAAGAGDAAVLSNSQQAFGTGTPTVSLTINADCTWTTTVTVNGTATTDPVHSMTAAGLASAGGSFACAATNPLTLPATFTFDTLGGVNNSGRLSIAGTASGSTTTWGLQILGSGTLVRTNGAS